MFFILFSKNDYRSYGEKYEFLFSNNDYSIRFKVCPTFSSVYVLPGQGSIFK